MQQRLAATRARLLDVALALVAQRGYAGCSMAAVAQAADVGMGTLYRYFPSKGELFAEVFRIACAREVAAAAAGAGEVVASGARQVDGVVSAVRIFAERALRSGTLAYALIIEPVDVQVDVERLAFRESYRNMLAVTIRAAIEAGEIPEQDATLAAACIVGAIGEALVLPLARGQADPTAVSAMTAFTRRSLGDVHVDHS